MTESSELARVRAIVEPIAADLDLDVYDIERRGVTVRVTLDTHPGSDGGITLDNLSLATRLISREIDHEDPISTRFTLEVTSPGLERQLRTPAHFQREVGKDVTVRFRDPNADPRRIDGQLTVATDTTATLLLDDGTGDHVRTRRGRQGTHGLRVGSCSEAECAEEERGNEGEVRQEDPTRSSPPRRSRRAPTRPTR